MNATPTSASPNPAVVARPLQRISAEQLAAAERLRDYWVQRHLASLRRETTAADERDEPSPGAGA